MWNSSENVFSRSNSSKEIEDDEETLRWATLERLPTYNRVSRGIFRSTGGDSTEVEIGNLKPHERKLILDRLFNAAGEDAGQLFDRMRKRFDAVDLKFPKIEVRFQQLKADAYVHIGSRALPTVPNVVLNMTEVFLRQFKIFPGRRKRLSILNNISGIIRPARMTLLLGPPSSGKTTLLLALAGRLGPGLEGSSKCNICTYASFRTGHSEDKIIWQSKYPTTPAEVWEGLLPLCASTGLTKVGAARDSNSVIGTLVKESSLLGHVVAASHSFFCSPVELTSPIPGILFLDRVGLGNLREA